MNLQELINRLMSKYKNAGDYDIQDLRKWLERQSMTDKQFDLLYEEIIYTYNYKTFPALPAVIEAWSRVKPTGQGYDISDREQTIIERWRNMDVKDILTRLQNIRKKINEGRADFTDKTFFNLFDDILVEHNIMMDAGFEGDRIKGHLNYILDCLRDKKNFRSIGESIANKNMGKLQDEIKKVFPSKRG